jgi:PncC family amidohydrolase
VDDVLAKDVGKLLRSRGLTISVAESCTGGKVGDMITNMSGSSDYFLGGVISYSNRAKTELLGVRSELLSLKGAVSDEVARQMASGVRKSLHSDIGVGITGIAGPLGGTADKPVGLVHIAVCSAKSTISEKNVFKGSRTRIKTQSAERALEMVKEFLLRT